MEEHTAAEVQNTDEEKTGANLNEMFAQLSDVIAEMEKEGVSLEESFALYSRGMELVRACNKTIDEVEQKVLVLDENGEAHDFQ